MVAEGLPAQLACRVLDVSESGFYAWRSRPPSERAIRHAWLTDLIGQIHVEFRGVYGYRRVHAELTLGHGLIVGAEAVWLLMRKAGLQGLTGRPKYRRIPNQPTASDLVDRDFARNDPDRLWLTDITEHPTREGKVYCAVVLDVFSRRVVGWSIDSTQNAALVTNALGMAIGQRNPSDGTVIHSDQGTPFTSWAFTRRALDSGLLPSMARSGTATTARILGRWSSPLWQDRRRRCCGWPDPCYDRPRVFALTCRSPAAAMSAPPTGRAVTS
jgi:putative transposase